MSNISQSDNATKPVRISAEVWTSASHEAIDRRASLRGVLDVAWKYFMTLPASERERLVRGPGIAEAA